MIVAYPDGGGRGPPDVGDYLRYDAFNVLPVLGGDHSSRPLTLPGKSSCSGVYVDISVLYTRSPQMSTLDPLEAGVAVKRLSCASSSSTGVPPPPSPAKVVTALVERRRTETLSSCRFPVHRVSWSVN